MSACKPEAAKARLGEVVRQAKDEGPQTITVRGRDAVVVMSVEDYARMKDVPAGDWVAGLREGALDLDFEFEREPSPTRDVDL